MEIAIISDIHGNCSALDSVLKDIRDNHKEAKIALLGDLIDYGMRSNEAISIIKDIEFPLVCNIWGNHENAIMTDDYSHFSSERGVVSAKNTKKHLKIKNIISKKTNSIFQMKILNFQKMD